MRKDVLKNEAWKHVKIDNHDPVDRIGIRSTSCLRNANLQLRNDPYILPTPVSPWLNSTIEPDNWRVTKLKSD